MPIKSSLFLTAEDTIHKIAPKKKGVYALYDSFAGLIYYGSSDNLQSALLEKKKNDCTEKAYYFGFEECADPIIREKELLDEYKSMNKKHPHCNEVI